MSDVERFFSKVAKKFGVSVTTICNVRNGKTWNNKDRA